MMNSKILQKYKELPKTIKASVWFLLCSFLQKGIAVITTPVFTRLLSPSEYGQYNVFNSWLGIVTVFVSLSLFNGVYTQGLIKYDEDKDKYSSSLQGLTLALIVIWLIVYLATSSFWNELFSLNTNTMLMMFGMIWMTSISSFWAAEQRVLLNYKKLVMITFAVSLANPIIGMIAVNMAKDKVTARLAGIIIVEVIAYSWMFFSQVKRGKCLFVKKYWIRALSLGIPLIPHYLAQNILTSSDKIMIEKMVGDNEAGIYSLAYSVSLIMLVFNNAFQQTINPWIFKKMRDNRFKDIESISYISLVIVGIVNALLILFAPDLVKMFAPKEYYTAIWIIPPVALSVVFQYLFSLFSCIEFYFEKTVYITIATGTCAVLNIALNSVFIRMYGYQAAGYTTLVCYIAQALIHYAVMRKICKDKLNGMMIYNPRVLMVIAILVMTIGLVSVLTYNYTVIRYACMIAIVLLCVWKRKYLIVNIKRIIVIRKNRIDDESNE